MTDNYELAGNIRRSLHDIRTHWDTLLQPTTTGGQGGAPTARITLPDHDPSETDIDRTTRIVSLRRETIDVLTTIARWVAEDRPVTKALPTPTADSLALFVDRHADWIADRDADDNGYEAGRLDDLAKRIVAMTAPPRKEFHTIGAGCPLEVGTGDEAVTCNGRVRVPIGGDQSEATCSRCGKTAVVSWWEDMMGMAVDEESVRSYDIAHMLAQRLKMTVTERTVRNWARDERIAVVHQFGPQPQKPNYWFNPRIVLGQVARMDRDCPMCGRIWSGEGEVCSRCYHAMRSATPRKAEPKRPTPAAVSLRPRHVVPDRDDTDRPNRCHWSDLPLNQCACGRRHDKAS